MAVVLALALSAEREALAGALRQAGHVVDLCEDAASVTQRALAPDAKLLLIDTCFDECDVAIACTELTQARAELGIVALGDGLSPLRRAHLLEAGADDVLARPFHLTELVARVDAVLRRVGRASRNLRAGRISVLEHERTAFVDAVSLDLTEREWSLLRYLARRADRTVTRAELLAKLWPSTPSPGSNVVDVHIAHLRQKLGDAGRHLRCVRGVGYRLEAAPRPSESS